MPVKVNFLHSRKESFINNGFYTNINKKGCSMVKGKEKNVLMGQLLGNLPKNG